MNVDINLDDWELDPNLKLIVTRGRSDEMWSAHVAVKSAKRGGTRIFCRRCEAVVDVPPTGVTYCTARLYPKTEGMQHKTCGQQFCFVE